MPLSWRNKKSMIFFKIGLMAVLAQFGFSAQAVRIELQADSFRARIFQNGRAEDIYKGNSLDIARGTVVELPDQFAVYDSEGKLNLKETLSKWRLEAAGANKPEYVKLYQDNNKESTYAYAYPVKIVTSQTWSKKISKSENLFMALGYIAEHGKFKYPASAQPQTVASPVAAPVVVRPSVPVTSMSPAVATTPERVPAKVQETRRFVAPPPVESSAVVPSAPTTIARGYGEAKLRCEIRAVPVGKELPVSLQANANNCSGVVPRLAPIADDHFRKMSANKRVEAFAEYLTPIAQYIQALTGFPASVLIAQAGIETGWGTSSLFRRHNGLFGKSCWRKGSRLNTSFSMSGVDVAFRGNCAVDRPAGEGGQYYVYDEREDSVWAYMYNVMYDDHSFYNGIRKDIQSARRQSPTAVADWQKVADGLKYYSIQGNKYIATIKQTIRNHDLDKIDRQNNSCQQCMEIAGLQIGNTSIAARSSQYDSEKVALLGGGAK